MKSMKKIWSVLSVLFLVACGDDSVSSIADDYSAAETSSDSATSSSSSLLYFSSAKSSSSLKSSSSKARSSSTKASSSSVKDSSSASASSSSKISSSTVVESSSSKYDSSSAGSSSSNEILSLSESSSCSESSRSVVESSSSYYFVIPEGPAQKVFSISLAEIKQNINKAMSSDLFATDTFEVNYTVSGVAAGMRYSATYYFVSKGKDRCYYEQSTDSDYLKKTRTVINGDRRKVIFFDGTAARILATEQSYTDSIRNVLGKQFKNPMDSMEWKEPIQVDDSIFRVVRFDGAELYYNTNKKSWELFQEQYISDDGDIVDAEYRPEYENGLINKLYSVAIVHSRMLGRDVASAITLTATYRNAESFPDKLFDF